MKPSERTILALALALSACGKTPAPAYAVADAGPSAESAAPDSLGDGDHDFQGTLGAKTSIAAHLVRTGPAVSGSYVYSAIGRPIALEGSVDQNGEMSLTETAEGKVTGTLRLHTQGADLVGQWSDPSGKNVFPLHLSPGPRFVALPGEGGAPSPPPAGVAKRAEECLARPTCSAADAARLFVAASEANDPTVDCFRFLDGTGTDRDSARARACFEHRAKTLECGRGSAGLETAELAMMRIDGVGGASDVAAARALLAGCFDDVTRSGILEHAAAKERDPRAPRVDFCKGIGGTTITSNECMARESKNADSKRELEAKGVAAGLDDSGRKLFAASEKAHGDYVAAMGAFVYEVYVQGTIRVAMSLSEEQRLKAGRAKELADFPRFVATGISAKEIESAGRELGAALAKVKTATVAEREALEKTQRAWTIYRDAELALYQHVFGPKQGVDRVHATVLVGLESHRAKDCAFPSAGPG
jgi:uncharacterized protein YecT (DUF1311 family)